MRTINYQDIVNKVRDLCLEIGCVLDADVFSMLKQAYTEENQKQSKFALDIMLKNAEIAKSTKSPLCQDTGMVVAFVEIGQQVFVDGGYIEDAINEGVRQAYRQGYFRKSVLDPINRQNTMDNTPAVVHYQINNDDKLKISIMLKGFGSENMSRLFMLTPSDGIGGIKHAVVTAVKEAKGNPCPPIIVGVGIGGTMEKASVMSKHALLRGVNTENSDSELQMLEEQLKSEINKLNIGAQGFGGGNTALKVLIEKYPTHIAGLPVAITIQCHASRHGEVNI